MATTLGESEQAGQSPELGPQPPTNRTQFRPDLEGLRGIAVALVVLYHFGIGNLPGGYVGVDVFYVLSGFFITTQLWTRITTSGRVNFREFYVRRARRLVPTAGLVLSVTMLATYFLLPHLLFSTVGWDGIFAAFNIVNYRFAAAATDYLQADQTPSPVLHYWSLSVEEQFYIVWPLLLAVGAGVLLARTRKRRTASRIGALAVIGTVTTASLVASIWLTTLNQPFAFFGLPTRAWELGFGALIALMPPPKKIKVNLFYRWMAPVGLLMVFGSVVFMNSGTQFPGYAALVPVGGAALLLPEPVGRLAKYLGARPLRALGRWSYSFYLWHWPVFSIAYLIFGNQGFTSRLRVILMVGSLLISALTFRFWEDPIRRSRVLMQSQAKTWSLVTACVGLACLSGGSLVQIIDFETSGAVGGVKVAKILDTKRLVFEGTRARPVPTNLVPSLNNARDTSHLASVKTHCMALQGDTAFPMCLFGSPRGGESLWLIGDSHANQWFTAFDSLAKSRNFALTFHARSGCSVLLNARMRSSYTKEEFALCSAWLKELNKAVAVEHPDVLVIANTVQIVGFQLDNYESELFYLRSNVGKLVVLGDTPIPTADVPVCVGLHSDDASFCNFNPFGETGQVSWGQMNEGVRLTALAAGAKYIDPRPWMCIKNDCPVILGNVLMYRDSSHITSAAADLLEPQLDLALQGALSSPQAGR